MNRNTNTILGNKFPDVIVLPPTKKHNQCFKKSKKKIFLVKKHKNISNSYYMQERKITTGYAEL